MAFIEPMHRNKPNITYLLVEMSFSMQQWPLGNKKIAHVESLISPIALMQFIYLIISFYSSNFFQLKLNICAGCDHNKPNITY